MIPLGLGIYMYYLNQQLHDPLYFIHAQPYFSAHREIGNLTIWPQVVWRYFKMIVSIMILEETLGVKSLSNYLLLETTSAYFD